MTVLEAGPGHPVIMIGDHQDVLGDAMGTTIHRRTAVQKTSDSDIIRNVRLEISVF